MRGGGGMSELVKKVYFRAVNGAAKSVIQPFTPAGRHIHTRVATPGGSVKNRRKPLSDNKAYLQTTVVMEN